MQRDIKQFDLVIMFPKSLDRDFDYLNLASQVKKAFPGLSGVNPFMPPSSDAQTLPDEVPRVAFATERYEFVVTPTVFAFKFKNKSNPYIVDDIQDGVRNLSDMFKGIDLNCGNLDLKYRFGVVIHFEVSNEAIAEELKTHLRDGFLDDKEATELGYLTVETEKMNDASYKLNTWHKYSYNNNDLTQKYYFVDINTDMNSLLTLGEPDLKTVYANLFEKSVRRER